MISSSPYASMPRQRLWRAFTSLSHAYRPGPPPAQASRSQTWLLLPAVNKPIHAQQRALLSQRQLFARQQRSIYAYAKVKPTSHIEDTQNPLDEKIGPTARLVDEDGNLQELQPVSQILQSIDRSTYFLRQVGKTEEDTPVCKVVEKQELFRKARERTKTKKTVEDFAKQIEITWSMSDHDLSYRLTRIQEFLAEGRRVEIMIGRKKGSRKITREEAVKLLNEVRAAAETTGTDIVEYLPMEGNLGNQVSLFYKNNAESELLTAKKDKDLEASEDRRAQREQGKLDRKEKEARRLEKKREREEERAKMASEVGLTAS